MHGMAPELNERTLTLINYNPEANEYEPLKTRVTIAVDTVQFVIAGYDTYCTIDGIQVMKTNVLFTSGNNLEIYISGSELATLERAVGAYFLP